jgi:uncharacterized protein YlxP (DUF503 family)
MRRNRSFLICNMTAKERPNILKSKDHVNETRVLTSQKKYSISITKTDKLTLFIRESYKAHG